MDLFYKNALLKNKLARTMMYTLFIGGLLLFSSSITWLLWNQVLTNSVQFSPISMLESVGIVAILYIIWFCYLYASKTEQVEKAEMKLGSLADDACNCNDDQATSRTKSIIKQMTQEEKIALKLHIAKCCGIPIIEESIPDTTLPKSYPTPNN